MGSVIHIPLHSIHRKYKKGTEDRISPSPTACLHCNYKEGEASEKNASNKALEEQSTNGSRPAKSNFSLAFSAFFLLNKLLRYRERTLQFLNVRRVMQSGIEEDMLDRASSTVETQR